MKEPEIITFGCRLNAYESEVIRAHVAAAGLGEMVVVNTCAVTAEAVRQARQRIRKARREHPAARLIVTGCAAQIAPERFSAMAEVDHVLGNEEKLLPESYERLRSESAPAVAVGDIMAARTTAHHPVGRFAARTRAHLRIQTGCDHRCTFCTIPLGRGNARSVPVDALVAEVRRLVASGHREVVLTGVDLTAYGRDLAEDLTLGKLVRAILREVPELARLRLSSIDSIEVDEALMAAIAEEARLMPHLHLSLQSGDDLILKRMKRRHLRAQAIRFCEDVRRLRPDVVFGADLIAGFPTESEAMFQNTLDLIDDCGLTYVHAFAYSPRPGTPAARMPQVPRAEIKARAARLRAHAKARLEAYLESEVGKVREVLVERPGRARTPQFAEVELTEPCPPGAIVAVRLTAVANGRLKGSLCTDAEPLRQVDEPLLAG